MKNGMGRRGKPTGVYFSLAKLTDTNHSSAFLHVSFQEKITTKCNNKALNSSSSGVAGKGRLSNEAESFRFSSD